jgi:signal transduction histidine kinase/DNA-binding response OmpR family regulator
MLLQDLRSKINRTFIPVFTLFVFSFFGSWMNEAHAQVDKKHAKQYISVEWEEALLAMLEEQLAQSSKTPLHFYFLEKIEAHCQDDLDCQWDSYWVVMDELNALKLHLQCIPLTERLIELARARQDEEGEISALWKLNRFHVFMEDFENETKDYLQLLDIYEEKGDIGNVLYLKTLLAEDKALYLHQVDEAIAEMKPLLAQAKKLNVPQKNKIIRRLYLVYQELNMTSELPGILADLEKIPISDPPELENIAYLSGILTGRALLAWEAKDYEQAEALFLKDLEINKTRFDGKGDIWYDIDIKHRWARMEWERGNRSKAEAILEETYEGAVAYQFHDHIRENLEMRTAWAEETRRYADALQYTRAYYAHEEQLDSVFANFDAQRFYTQLANERLEGEKNSQALELRAKNNQLLSLLLAAALILLVAGGLWLGYRRLQKAKQVLYEQNLLIEKQASQLRNLDAAKTRFFANVSHELRTPLTLMTGPVDSLLKKGQFSAEETQLLKMVARNGQQLQQLINSILDLQKMEAGKMDLQAKPTPLATFFSTHLGQFESLATSKEIDYAIDIDLAAEAVAELDQEKCRQILNNLLSNAFKFTPRGGCVCAAVALKGKELHLEVSDSGPGIHPDDLPYVFDPYFQTTRPEKPIEGGTGLGLALCKEYAQLFGGQIVVRNNPEKGASFSLSFPLRLTEQLPAAKTEAVHATDAVFEPMRPAATLRTAATQGNAQERPTLLIVEDNAELRDYLSLILRDQYQLVLAADGQEALDYLLPDSESAAAPCQLILSDLMMPRLDGYQLVERLKSTDATRHLPVVMLTARADARDKLKALRLGVDDYLLKPFQEEELKVRIANLLRNQAVRLAASPPEPAPAAADPLLSPSDQEWLARFEGYVQDNIDSDILSVSGLAYEFTMSESTFNRQLKRLIGLSPGQYLKEVRLDQARCLLENRTYDSVEQVASAVGYGDYRSFSRSFKQRYGKLPSVV